MFNLPMHIALFLLLLLLDPLMLLLRKYLVVPLLFLLLGNVQLLQPLLCKDFALAWLLGHWWFRKRLYTLLSILLDLSTSISLHASIDQFAKLLDLLQRLLILFFHFTNDLEWSMLLAEDTIVALSVDALDFKEVVRTACTFDVERNHAASMLALDAGTLITFSTNDALKIKSLDIDLAHANRSLGRHGRSRYPHSTAEVDPLVERISIDGLRALEALLVPLQEESVVFRNLSDGLGLKEVKFDSILVEVFAIFSRLS